MTAIEALEPSHVLVGRVPQRDVAAYLGITEVALSRITSRRRKRAA